MSNPSKQRSSRFIFQAGTWLGIALAICPDTLFAAETGAGSRWEPEIAAFEAADKTNPPPQHGILFVGSSSIRLWKTLAADFPDQEVINRGFGGSQIEDSTAFAERIVVPYHPRMIFLYAGDNDIAAGKSPETVLADYRAFVKKVETDLPGTRIGFIAIKPSLARWKLVDNIRQANALVKAFAATDRRQVFIDVFAPMLGPDGKPRRELFAPDGLHMNHRGYDLWVEQIRPWLK
ncbi:MAG: SGNH/GDSL hydrolase family protein [Limisphaerales bacterium]